MWRSRTRSTWIIPALVATATMLLALSFAPWASGRTPATRGKTSVVAAAPATSTNLPPTPLASTPTRSPAEIGRTLFALKGCATCHRHDGLENERLTRDGQTVRVSRSLVGANGTPDLTHYQPDPDFIRTWLKDPKAIRPNTLMPDLGLSEDEIEALLAFLQTNTVKE